ncbi:MAG TPA: hypothetical protein VFA70_02695, partial [Dehalococcoidia bacterium]|nr:hypothetical protein [Dehalococcoidia bacterium]
MRIASAFLLRDLRIAWSYRFSFLVQNVSLLFSLLSLKFIAQLFGASAPAALKTYGGEYFSFALLGTCVTLFSYPAVRSFAQGVRAAQTTGTFEVMLTTRARPSVIVLSAGLYPILFVCLQALAALLIGWLLLGARLQAGQLLLALAVFAMFLVSLVGLGLISAAFVVAFRQTEPLTSALISVS